MHFSKLWNYGTAGTDLLCHCKPRTEQGAPAAGCCGRSALFEEYVIGGIGRTLIAAGLVASAVELSAVGTDPLRRGDARKNAGAAMRRHFEF